MRKVLWSVLLCALLFAFPALCEDAYTLSIRDNPAAQTDKNYVRISCPLDEAGDVTVTVKDSSGSVVYQRYYPGREGQFRSEDIYLKHGSSTASYSVEVSCGSTSYQRPALPDIRSNRSTARSPGFPSHSWMHQPWKAPMKHFLFTSAMPIRWGIFPFR